MGGVKEGTSMANDTAATPVNGSVAIVPAAQATLDATPQAASLVSPFSNSNAFESAQRMAKALASSSLVPQAYRNDVANCLIAMEVASRIGVSVLPAMQNLHIIQGRPSWSSSFLIASVNASGRFTPLRYEWSGKPGEGSWACRAKAKSKEDGELCVGAWITWEMAVKEGWTKKNGSKWLTMPEQMFQYRAAAFWQRAFCPEISIGFHTAEEVQDMHSYRDMPDAPLPVELTPAGAESLSAVLGLQQSAQAAVVDADGVVVEPSQSAPIDATPTQATLIDDEPKRGKR